MKAIVELISTEWESRSLIFELIKREFSGRYQGSLGGVFWSFLQPDSDSDSDTYEYEKLMK